MKCNEEDFHIYSFCRNKNEFCLPLFSVLFQHLQTANCELHENHCTKSQRRKKSIRQT
jgi:hypothetical protein